MSRDDRGPEQPGDASPWRGGQPSSYGGLYGGYGDAPGDPAYADRSGWAPPPYSAPLTNATRPLSPYWTSQSGPPPPADDGGYPPEPPGSPRWLWVVAGVAVVLVVGLAVALVIVTSNSSRETVVAPAPALTPTQPEPTAPTSRPTRSLFPPPTTTSPSAPSAAAPTTTAATPPSGSQTVTYQVDGSGRAINITYVDTDNMLQTEFNVTLPWTREVTLRAPAANSASVTILNVGNQVTCSVIIDGARIRQITGIGLTSCNPLS